MSKLEGYSVELVPRSAIQNFIEKYHYSHNTNGIQGLECFALFSPGKFNIPRMVGAMMYAIPSMPNTARKYNPVNPDKCVELRRLVCLDEAPKNSESFFVSQTIKWLKQNTNYEVIVSFADRHYGHEGVIYKASNFVSYGQTAAGRVLMVDGKEYHSRSLSQPEKPYSREIRRRWEAGDENIFFIKRKNKNIYVYYLNKGIKKKIKRIEDEKVNSKSAK